MIVAATGLRYGGVIFHLKPVLQYRQLRTPFADCRKSGSGLNYDEITVMANRRV